MTNLERAFELFDSFNRQDPRELLWEGTAYPYEYFYALQLYNWVKKLKPLASEPLLLASRAQHIGRWKSPREDYPDGKAGYLRWRSDLKKYHADTAGALLTEAGYDDETVKAVQKIILKEQLKSDPNVQVMEDALCLVFLQFQYEDFLKNHDEEKVVRVLKKSWGKMSQPGRDAASALAFGEKGNDLLKRATCSPP